jgi:hypothetical protein
LEWRKQRSKNHAIKKAGAKAEADPAEVDPAVVDPAVVDLAVVDLAAAARAAVARMAIGGKVEETWAAAEIVAASKVHRRSISRN